jgi:hypothetical protein
VKQLAAMMQQQLQVQQQQMQQLEQQQQLLHQRQEERLNQPQQQQQPPVERPPPPPTPIFSGRAEDLETFLDLNRQFLHRYVASFPDDASRLRQTTACLPISVFRW